MVPAIYYHPDGFETSRENLMGRHAAGEGMLQALCRYGSSDHLYAYCTEKKHFEHFVEKVKKFSSGQKTCTWIHPLQWQKLKEPGSIFMAGPVLSDLAYLRRHGDQRDFSICGVTHTTATDKAMDGIGDLLTAPIQPWDALVCTSHSVRSMVATLLQNQKSYLAERLGAPLTDTLPLELPVIPLGVDCDAFDISEEKKLEYRKSWREKLKMSMDDLAVLYVGRFSFFDKAHPLPMFLAMEQCAQALKKPLCLIMSGWFQSEAIKKQFIEGSKTYCPSVKVAFVDGRNAAVRNTIWHAADIFTSLADNVQETFGLTPIEAMAAGLPCVVSDWNGYKESVRHGVDGFRVATWMAPPGFGAGLALAYASGAESYGAYVGYQSQFTSVDLKGCAVAYAKLLTDEALRKQMGQSGKERARALYDWKVVIKQYEDLWNFQADARSKAIELGARKENQPANPLRDDPFTLFSLYPTRWLGPDTQVLRFPGASKARLQLLGSNQMNTFGIKLTYPAEQIITLLESIPETEPITVQSLCSKVPAVEGRALLFSLLWLAKLGMLHLAPAPAEQEIKQEELSTAGT